MLYIRQLHEMYWDMEDCQRRGGQHDLTATMTGYASYKNLADIPDDLIDIGSIKVGSFKINR